VDRFLSVFFVLLEILKYSRQEVLDVANFVMIFPIILGIEAGWCTGLESLCSRRRWTVLQKRVLGVRENEVVVCGRLGKDVYLG